MTKYDPAKHSQQKLGAVGTVPVLPMIPVAAQLSPYSGIVHYKLDELGNYVNGRLPLITPSKYKELKEAIKLGLTEPSYSGTGTDYKHLDVTPDPEHADRFLILLGGVTVGFGLVEPSTEIVSTDEPAAGAGDAGPDADTDDTDADADKGDTIN